jgi:tungstate transport system ATP-binding protein
MNDSRPPLYSVSELSFSYDRKPAVRCPSLELFEGQATAFVGPNGSGKTSLLKLLNGLLGPYRGSVHFLGRELVDSGVLRRRSMYLHQHPVMFAGSVRENLAYPLVIRRMDRKAALARADEQAESMGLSGLLLRPANRLSGGETQRVALARALIAGADVLLLDEPTSSMDAASIELLYEILLGLRDRGITLIFSAHDEKLVSTLAVRVVGFSDGSVEAVP